MSELHEEMQGYHGPVRGFPWRHVVGLILSIALTLIALWLVVNRVMTGGSAMAVILILAMAQIAVQLAFFMHFTESRGPRYHITGLSLALFFTFCIVAGSIWIMTFGGHQAY